MTVEVLYLDGCPHYQALLEHLLKLLHREGIEADLVLQPVNTEHQAQSLRFLGSPTVRVEGSDIEAEAAMRRDFGLKCRLYSTPHGLEGMPPDEWIIAAIRVQPQSICGPYTQMTSTDE